MSPTRRAFLQSTTLPFLSLAQPAGWYDRPMRWIQIAFVEDDPGQYNLNFWLDYCKRIHADAACLSAGGCVAFYPTKIPLHYKSKWMKPGMDPFGELTNGCRSQGMNVIARVDPHAFHDDLAKAHPDWVAVDSQGKPRPHWAMPGYWVSCGLGPYNFEFMREVVNEITATYKPDGIFSNRWSGSGMCYCVHCQQNFRSFSGRDLPRTTNPADPAQRDYLVWRSQRLFELWELWDGDIRKINPQAAFLPNTGGGATTEIDMVRAGKLAPTLFADRQARRGVIPAWANGKNAKEYRATFGSKPIAGLFSVGLEEPYRWKDSVQSPEEIRLWAVDGIAQGIRPWVIKFNAKPLDDRWFGPVEELFVWHWRNKPYLRNVRPLADVGLVYSQQTAKFYGGENARARTEDHTLGAYHSLVEARIPFEMVHEGLLDPESLRPYRVLVLPNIAALSDAQCAQLQAFVERGGAIVATHETSLCDEWGKRRPDFGLAAVFGVSYGGNTIERQANAYILIEDRNHPLLIGLQGAGRFIHGVQRVELKASVPAPLTTLPTYPDLPMEEVYPRVAKTGIPAVICREFGAGRAVYFPWDIDRTFWEVMSPDHGRLFSNAVQWAAKDPRPLQVAGPGILDVAYWQQADSVTVNLVNLTNPMMMKGPVREVIPIGPQKVRMKLPQGKQARSVKFLVGGSAAQWRQTGDWLETVTPQVHLFEIVAVDF